MDGGRDQNASLESTHLAKQQSYWFDNYLQIPLGPEWQQKPAGKGDWTDRDFKDLIFSLIVTCVQ